MVGDVPAALLSSLTWFHPSDPTRGSPFNTGKRNQLSPQFKRMAALIGDMAFVAPRRYFAQSRSEKQPVYVFGAPHFSPPAFGFGFSSFNTVSERFKNLEHLGAAHSSDLVDPFSGGVTADYFIQFITYLDPNGHSMSPRSILPWPRYSNELPSVMRFFHDDEPVSIGRDDFRKEGLNMWNRLVLGDTSVPP